ncbi:alpha/beta hydrolase [Occultella glacieicola]|uniref:Alpha/beta hydrolase n=1 Tax=Occultella glacieicola TaxID=2518684 RepID=A0ABY2EBI9_9MICO|nr:alpha/beta hydrolase [Occultella glacieicola]TDE97589.1 alpha/beta hydrolase [Occultella glacieicola]
MTQITRDLRPPRPRAAAIAVLATAGLLIGSATAAGAAPPMGTAGATEAAPPVGAAQVDAPVPELDWVGCGEGLEGFECASAEVPSDYDDPQGATTTIALTRLPATDPDERIGSLFLNFGGPGGSGVASLHALGPDGYGPDLRARFDIIGFDPRGVGLSDPVTCFRNADAEARWAANVESFPVGPHEEARYIGAWAVAGASCTAISGDRIATSSSANVARDMDLLRQAVGDQELNYLGYSYGTHIGATYGALFPDRIRAMVLDGTWDPEAYVGLDDDRTLGRRIGQAPAASEAYAEFLRLCAEAGQQGCALAALGDPEQVMEDLFAQLRAEPAEVPLEDGTTITIGYDDAVATIFSSLYAPAGWADLAAAMASLVPVPDQAATLSAPPDALGNDSIQDLLRRVGILEDYPSMGGALASMCVDAEHPGTAADYPAQAAAEEAQAPHFGTARAWAGVQCESIPVADEDRYAGPWEQDTDAPVLVIGTRYDPATPYAFTEPYADLWNDARMLTVEGYGHTTLATPSACANAAITDYLIDLEATDGATCTQDVAPFTAAAQEQVPASIPVG